MKDMPARPLLEVDQANRALGSEGREMACRALRSFVQISSLSVERPDVKHAKGKRHPKTGTALVTPDR